jgi:hypothetical protein
MYMHGLCLYGQLYAPNALPSSIPQVMSHSMVSPGFWCQAPKALVPHIGAKTKDVWFETTDRLCGTDATDFRVRSAGDGRSCTAL